ncbi:MBL fold metallo-hydrolase RNA specificity domain-containing protein [Pararhodobacter oceanensis]|uniref:MBL fold metallo-hydrolase n=1 Tax=Pararhodobacter oceanensis TaxID=2172121 RepID=A0A2T8HPF3_9RHOB|nr:MBL fold metallo-hydrolase [Pararhodobacter oceanensis]PVH27296.1 MBL fold metallo-hydrolase [Pararhodobacter oceanensis]
MSIEFTFFGAAGTVTGSRFLLESGGRRILIDCGLFQGQKSIRERNWKPFPVEAGSIDAVVLTHAHIDHSGNLPRLVREGFRGKIHCTTSTRALCDILLADSGYLHERDAQRANQYGYSKHHPALPLYTAADAKASMELFETHPFEEPVTVAAGVTVRFRRAGHILGAASVEVRMGGKTLVFSGDIGRYGSPIMEDPIPFKAADVLVMESTYGDRLHDSTDPEAEIGAAISETVAKGGTVVIPSFAVGRAQSLMYVINRLKQRQAIADIPVFLDSPMAINASGIYCANSEDHRLSEQECHAAYGVATYTRSAAASQAIIDVEGPKIVISASGMATGGRILHHLSAYLPDARNTVLFAGFQAAGTRGAALVDGAPRVKIHGANVPVRAQVRNLTQLSAHADRDELLRWLGGFTSPPKQIYITHGEDRASQAFRSAIEEKFGWQAEVPQHFDKVVV